MLDFNQIEFDHYSLRKNQNKSVKKKVVQLAHESMGVSVHESMGLGVSVSVHESMGLGVSVSVRTIRPAEEIRPCRSMIFEAFFSFG